MNYRRRNRNSHKNIFIALGLILLIGILVVIFGFGRAATNNALSPLLKFSVNLKENSLVFFQNKKALTEEVKALQQKNRELLLRDFSRNLLEKENEELKSTLGRSEDTENVVLARITSKPPISPFDLLTIDVGSNHGVKRGDKVLAAENIEIGTIDAVFNNSASVIIYSSSGERTPAEINNSSSLIIAEGEGGGSFVVQAPRTLKVSKGDFLSRPALNTKIIGIVESTELGETDAFMVVRAKLPVNIFEISWVYVKTSEPEQESSEQE